MSESAHSKSHEMLGEAVRSCLVDQTDLSIKCTVNDSRFLVAKNLVGTFDD